MFVFLSVRETNHHHRRREGGRTATKGGWEGEPPSKVGGWTPTRREVGEPLFFIFPVSVVSFFVVWFFPTPKNKKKLNWKFQQLAFDTFSHSDNCLNQFLRFWCLVFSFSCKVFFQKKKHDVLKSLVFLFLVFCFFFCKRKKLTTQLEVS